MAFIEKIVSSEIVYNGPIFNIRKYNVQALNGPATRDVLEHNGAVIIIAITPEGKILMERQFRMPFNCELMELPAGKIDKDEEPEHAALRELAEETGYRAGSIKRLMTYYPTCGYSTEILHIYVCRDLIPGDTNLDPGESVDVIEYNPDELYELVMNNEIKDSKTIIGILFAKQAGEI